MTQKIIVTVDANGDTTIRAEGYTGRACIDATHHFEYALGRVTKDEKTREFSQTQQARTVNQ